MNILENNSNNILLYRGDSSYIDHFDINKTDPMALFGMGIYLTDNKLIAKDYTTKGPSNIIFPEYSNDEYKSQTYLVRDYLKHIVYDELRFKDRIEEIKEEMSEEFSKYTGSQPDGYWRDRERVNKDNKELNDKFKERLKQEFSEYFEKAKKIWIQRKKTLSIFKNTMGTYTLCNKKSNSNISIFSIPIEYIERTFDGEAPLPNDVLNVMRSVLEDFILNQNMDNDKADHIDNRIFGMRAYDDNGNETAYTFDEYIMQYKKNGARYAWRNDVHGGDNQNPSFDILTNGTHNLIWKEKKHQLNMINKLQKLGYTGISYQGGVRVNTAKGDTNIRGGGGMLHRAYVIWDGEYLDNHRIDNEIPINADIKSIGNKISPNSYIF